MKDSTNVINGKKFGTIVCSFIFGERCIKILSSEHGVSLIEYANI